MIPPILLPLALGASLLAPLPEGGGEDGPQWVPSLRKAFEMSKDRGAPILVWCVGDADSAEKADHETLRHREVQKAMKGFLVVLANPVDTHGTQDGTLEGKAAKVCRLAPGIACSDHMRAWSEVYGSYADVMGDKSGNIKVPNHFVVGTDGKIVAAINNGTIQAGFDAVPPPQMAKGLKDALAKAGGPGLTDAQYAEFQKSLAAARTLVEGNRMREAAQVLRPLSEIRKNIALVVDARELLARVDREAAAAFAKANALLKEKPLAGVAGLDQVVEDYPGTESAESARKAVEAFKGSPEGKKALRDMAREKAGREELAKALDLAGPRGDDTRALRALDAVARKYAGLPVAEAAEARAAAIRNDPERMKAVQRAEDERAAKSALVLALGMRDGGRKEEARAKLAEILEKYPETDAAKEAAGLLEELR